jgi:integrase
MAQKCQLKAYGGRLEGQPFAGIGLVANPVHNRRKPSSGAGHDRRLHGDEEKRLQEALAKHSNPMIAWIVRIALETGMRPSEITGLHLRQVELSRRIVRLSTPKTIPHAPCP